MQISCFQENLRRGLSIVQRVISSRSTLPITQNVLIETDGTRLKLSATNLEISITTWIGAQIEGEGRITIPARLLTDFVNALPNERIDMKMEENSSLKLTCMRYEANFNGIPADDFPTIPSLDNGETIQVSGTVLHDAINKVVFAAAAEDSRPVLTGVKVEAADYSFTFASADGFRMSVYDGALENPMNKRVEFILPAKALQEVERFIGNTDDIVEFTVALGRNQALFRLENIELVSQLIDGQFPDFRQLVPESYNTRTILKREETLRSVRAAAVFARDNSGIIRLEISPEGGIVKISAVGGELGDQESDIHANVEGEHVKIAFNNKYLMDIMESIGCEYVAFETSNSQHPGVIKPSEKSEDFDYTHVIMPMFVQW